MLDGSFFVVMSPFGSAGHAQVSPGKTPNEIAPCPDSPNCVSSRSQDPGRAMPPLPYLQSGRQSMDRLLAIVRGMKLTLSGFCCRSQERLVAHFLPLDKDIAPPKGATPIS